jgi:hypothetical protein
MVGWDENATKATNVAGMNKLMVASYYNFTIFPASMALTCYVYCRNNSFCHYFIIIVIFKSPLNHSNDILHFAL